MENSKVSKNNKNINGENDFGFKEGDFVKEKDSITKYGKILKAQILEIHDNGVLLGVYKSTAYYMEGQVIKYYHLENLDLYIEQEETQLKKKTRSSYGGVSFTSNVDFDLDVVVEEPKVIDYDNLESMKELNALIGLGNVKKQIEEMIANIRIEAMRKEYNLKTDKHSLHMIFKGASGTGKTTVARIIGKLMAEIGVLKGAKDKEVPFIEIIHTDVTGKFVGEAEKAIAQKFQEAKGGILFIDEVYSFDDGDSGTGNDQVKANMVTTMVKLMEEMKDEVIVIGAGYSKEVDKFITANTGLSSRFPNRIIFEDYSAEENTLIAEYFCENKDYVMTPDYLETFKKVIQKEMTGDNFGNARTVRNIIEKSIRAQSNRILKIEDKSSITKETLMTLTVDDLLYEAVETKTKKTIGFLA